MNYHEPVLAEESIAMLAVKRDGTYVDATYGGGGHSRLILSRLGEQGRLFAFDQDDDALAHLAEDNRFVFNHHNFRFIRQFMRLHGVQQVDGILADLGVSSHQLDMAERGFSFRFEAELDMRMNRSQGLGAADIVNRRSAGELQQMFSDYGEVRNARSLAQRIVQERAVKPIRTIGDFLRILEPLVRGSRSRYLAQVFQSLRIEVNDEMGALKDLLEASLELLAPGGRLVVIAYHSIEDRMVKNFLKTGSVSGEMSRDFFGNIERPFDLVGKGVVTPSPAETRRNPRSRSARLRAGIRRPA